MLQTINLFSYSTFFRFNGKAEVSHSCGGIASLILLGAIGVAFILKLIEAWGMNTVFFSTQTVITPNSVGTTVSTFPRNTSYQQYMLAFRTGQQGIPKYRVIYSVGRSDPTFKQLQACTADHFPNHDTQGIQTEWSCLPLNTNFTIRGTSLTDSNYQGISFFVSAVDPSLGTGSIIAYQTTSIINPGNKEKPFESFINLLTFQVAKQYTYYYRHTLNENILITDTTLFPGQKLQQQKSISSNGVQVLFVQTPLAIPSAIIQLSRSLSTTTVKRHYLKYSQVLSDIGGLFSALSAAFFFINAFGSYFFEIFFSMRCFQEPNSRSKSFWAFLKQSIYSVFKGSFLEPNWELAKKQNRIRQVMNTLLDIEYLYDRIYYLQQIISCCVESHQLTGIYLGRKKTLDEIQEEIKKHRLRKRLRSFMMRHFSGRREQGHEQKPQKKPSTSSQLIMKQPFQKNKSASLLSMILQTIDHGHQEQSAETISDRPSRQLLKEWSGQISEPDLTQIQINQLQQDLLCLAQEAKDDRGDLRSKRIFQDLDSWVKHPLQNYQLSKQVLSINLVKGQSRSK